MFNNPLIQRYRYSLMRPRQLWIYVTIYVSIVALLLFFNYTIYIYQDVYDAPEDFFKTLYAQFLLFEVLVLWLWAARNTGTALKEELTAKTYDFFRMLPLPAHQKAAGILAGRNLVALLLAAVNCLFLICFGTMGKLSAMLQGQVLLVLASGTLLVNSLILLCSLNPAKGKKRANLAVFILFAFFAVPFFLRAMAGLSGIEGLEHLRETFFHIEIPILLLITLIALYFSCWALKGILRKFNREQEPLFTRIGAFLFLLGYEFVLFGLYYRHLPDAGTNMNYSYWLISLLAILAIPPTSLRSFDKYLEHSGLVRERHSSNARAIVSVLSYSNLSLALGLFAAWAAASIWICRITGMQLTRCLYPLLTTLSFYLLFVLLLELYVVYSPLSAKIGLLLGFIGIVYLFFPLILSAILESKIVYLYSPLGFWWNLFERPHWVPTVTTSTQRSILLTSALLCLIPALLVAKRYAGILAIRRKM